VAGFLRESGCREKEKQQESDDQACRQAAAVAVRPCNGAYMMTFNRQLNDQELNMSNSHQL
jgi:hypothetical protein